MSLIIITFPSGNPTSSNLGSLRRASGLCRNRNKKPFSIAPVLGAVRTSHK
jgi:hypothetical protein